MSKRIEGILDAVQEVVSRLSPVDQFGDPRLLDIQNLDQIPDVPQFALERYEPPRGMPPNLKSVLTPQTAERLREAALRGEDVGGREWYNTTPMRDQFVSRLGEDAGGQRFNSFIDKFAATSPRSTVAANTRRASLFDVMDQQGLPFGGLENSDLPAGYGHLAHKTQDHSLRELQDRGSFAAINRPKTSSFAENLKGNQTPMTIDTHNMAAVMGDPTFKKSPSNTQYKYLEQFQAEIADKLGMTPAQYQASVWMGAGTGVADARPVVEVFDDVIARTALRDEKTKKQVMDDFIAGKAPLYSLAGGAVLAGGIVTPENASASPLTALNAARRLDAADVVGQIGDIAPLPDAPTSANIPGVGRVALGQNSGILDSAQRYAETSGIDLLTPTKYLPIDEQFSRRVAAAYDAMPHDPQNSRVRQAYSSLSDEVMQQYEQMLRDGVKPFYLGQNDPYSASPYLALKDLYDNQRLGVFPTTSGYGVDDAFNDNPLLEPTDYKIDGKPVLVNDAFRAVHDYYGHGGHTFGFRGAGEDNAYRAHSGMFSPDAMRAIATETRGQNSLLNYGPFGEKNRTASLDDTIFADQKAGLLPNDIVMARTPLADERLERYNSGVQRSLRDKLAGAINPDGTIEAVHYARQPLDVIDPNRYGSGLSGRTISEVNMARNPEFDNRSFYGLDTTERPYKREQGLGSVENRVDVKPEQIYDILEDPDNIKLDPKLKNLDPHSRYVKLTRKINDLGYSAVFQDHPQMGKFLQIFDPMTAKKFASVPIAMLGTEAVRSAIGDNKAFADIMDERESKRGTGKYPSQALANYNRSQLLPTVGVIGQSLVDAFASGADYFDPLNLARLAVNPNGEGLMRFLDDPVVSTKRDALAPIIDAPLLDQRDPLYDERLKEAQMVGGLLSAFSPF